MLYMYIHLTNHSAYSLQEGLLLPDELAQAARADGMPALGLTDHRLLTGAVEFVAACKRAEIQPVLGLEIDFAGTRLSLLAASLVGWVNLCRLSSAQALGDSAEGDCSMDLLAAHSSGLIVLSDHTDSLQGLKELFPDHLYVALRDPQRALPLATLAHRLALPCVVAHPVYTLTPAQNELQRTLAAIRLNQPRDQLPVAALAPAGSHFLGSVEVEARFAHFPNALAATREIAERCQFDLPLGASQMPAVPLPPGVSAAAHLRQKADAGARRLYGEITPEIRTRLDHELDVIARAGFEPIFLIVEEILDYARRTDVPFSSRGSAASSLVAHCLGITSPDPLRLNLYFERFLNPARVTPPDIDTDLCSRGRDGVIRHVFETYGEERVAMVGIINRFRPRSALGEVAKAHGLPSVKVRELVNQLPYHFWAGRVESDEDDAPPSAFADLRAAYPAQARIFDEAEALLKLPRHLSVHAGGLIVAPGPLTDFAPVMRSGSKSITITQLDLESVEALGLVKIDLLGIRGLTVLGDVAAWAREAGSAQSGLSVLEAVPADDPQTAARIESGLTIGCFQIESPGMRATLREIRARTEDDIMAALALYRPGPLTGGLKDAFVRRFKGDEPVEHIHSALAPLLGETFGVILYQEQVLRIAHELAGFSLAEADLLRRAMSHFDPGKRMQELRQKFVGEAAARGGIPAETGERIWEMMAAFAGYGFPKAHAASYAQVAWRSAWCKTYFPAQFMAAVLANWGGYYSQRVYLNEARKLGLSVRPPHVNHAGRQFQVGAWQGMQALFMGLDQVKELTGRTIGRILHERPFHSLDDFLTRANPRPQEAEDLARIGALDGLGTIPGILRRLQGGGWRPGQMSLFQWDEGEGEDWSLAQKVNAQETLLGVSLAAHPLELVNTRGAITTLEAVAQTGRRVTVAGVRQSSRRSRTSKGETMMFLTLEDLAGTLDVILFPDAYRRAKAVLSGSTPLLLTGIIERDGTREEPFLRAEQVTLLHQ